MQVVEPLEKQEASYLLDDFERIGNAAGPEGIPEGIDFTADFAGEHGARSFRESPRRREEKRDDSTSINPSFTSRGYRLWFIHKGVSRAALKSPPPPFSARRVHWAAIDAGIVIATRQPIHAFFASDALGENSVLI